jgi:hypothetical protein
MTTRRWALIGGVTALLAAGCAQVERVASGDVVIRERLVVTTDRAWNQFASGIGDDTPTWTQDGITVDALRFYVALKDGALIAPTPDQPLGTKPLAFRATMGAREVVGLFEQLYSRGGSTFTLTKIEPCPFIGQNGFRFEFGSLRSDDSVQLSGIGWGAVRNGELFAITFTAPRLSFFARHLPAAEAVANSARVRG